MKKIFLVFQLILGLCFTEILAQTPTTGKNAVMEKTPREAMTTLTGATHTTVQTAIQYFDGLGKPTQVVVYKGSPDAAKDILSSTTQYDALGRAYKSILPTPSDGATGAYKSTAQTLATSFYDNDANPFAETIFEASPLNRPKQQYGAGQAWRMGAGHSVGMEYLTAGTEILHFEIRASGTIEKVGTYAGNSLICNRTISERDFKTNEYKDRLGRVVAKSQELTAGNFAISLYIYDDLNRLRIVIPPEAYQTVSTMASFTESSPVFLEGMFSYVYDARGRIAEKHVPGGGIMRYVYDKNDRVVLENDDRDAGITPTTANYYKFTKYDLLGRVVQTGLIFGIGAFTRSQLQTDFDNHAALTYEERVTTGGLLGYTNRSFPSGYTPIESSLRTVTYYDDFSWNTDVNFDFKPLEAFHAQASAKGMVTGKLIRNVKTSTWQKTVMYYNYQSHEIQGFHLTNRNNLIRKDFQYRFNGELLKTRIEKKSGSTVLSTKIMTYEYDHKGRKIKYKYLLNGSERTLVKLDYDDIGRMKTKAYSPSTPTGSKQTGAWLDNATWLTGSYPTISDQVTINSGHTITIPTGNLVNAGMLNDKGVLQNNGTLNLGNVKPSTTTLHSLSYLYHIHGGLKGINLDASGNLTNNIFSYKLDYETGSNPYYDGNISTQSWQSNIDGKTRSFSFTYDGASRLKSNTYTSIQVGENYALNNVSYDANGNITQLSRKGWKSNNTFGLVDSLKYTYNTNSNKILKVDDLSNETASFKDAVGNDYDFWQDGSLKKDNNKEISQIDYNFLKLPQKINLTGGRWIEYEYDANGTKLKKTLSTGKYTDYEEDEIYENGVLYQTTNDEGRIVDGVYEYNITDHLGNLRVAFKDSLGIAKITQVNAYGAFGEDLSTLKYINSTKSNLFNFNAKEVENDFSVGLIDYKNRFYDSVLGRFISEDKLASKFPWWTPFQFAGNRPIVAIDLDGLEPVFVHGTWSNPSTFSNQFKIDVIKATGWNNKTGGYSKSFQWSGANETKDRVDAAKGLVKDLNSKDNLARLEKAGEGKHTTLISHSHGGNVSKLAKNMLEKDGWKVDIINISTPQRADFQTSENKNGGVSLNFYSNYDAVQYAGSTWGMIGNIPLIGASNGSREDPSMKNMEVDTSLPINGVAGDAINVYQWGQDSAGHGLHNNPMSSSQIINEIRKAFNLIQK
jgi:RHS repeat-associated protein